MKPHICLTQTRRWICQASGHTGFGETPAEAYRDWHQALQSHCWQTLAGMRQWERETMLALDAVLSPDQLEPQLNLARGRGCGPDDAGVGRLKRIVRVIQKIWRRKVGVIQDVEKLRTKLHPESFSEGKVLEQGEIYGRQPRSIEPITARIANQNSVRHRRCRRKAIRIEGQ